MGERSDPRQASCRECGSRRRCGRTSVAVRPLAVARAWARVLGGSPNTGLVCLVQDLVLLWGLILLRCVERTRGCCHQKGRLVVLGARKGLHGGGVGGGLRGTSS